jgi:hypothetical protein
MTATHVPAQRPVAPRRVFAATLAIGMVVIGLVAAACAPKSSNASGAATSDRPTTPAELSIVSPEPNAVTGPTVDLKLDLTNATVVPAAQASGISPTQGHIHVSVDGRLVSMTYGLSQVLPGLSKGTHTIQAEFVASDHRPFANRVVAAVVFQVK